MPRHTPADAAAHSHRALTSRNAKLRPSGNLCIYTARASSMVRKHSLRLRRQAVVL